MGIGITLRTYRQEHDLSQQEMGERCGLSHSAISRIESGDRTELKLGTLLKLSSGLGITVDELLGATEEAPPSDRPNGRHRTRKPTATT